MDSTCLNFMKEKHANVESGVGYVTSEVHGKQIKAQSSHTAPPAVEENLDVRIYTYTYTCKNKVSRYCGNRK